MDALCQAFQAAIDGPEPAAARTAQFTVDGAAYYAVTPGQRTALMVLAPWRVWNLNATRRDPELPHQFVSLKIAAGLAVTCNCLARGCPRQFIATHGDGEALDGSEALALWRGWHERRGVKV
jgi:hypothetical protein